MSLEKEKDFSNDTTSHVTPVYDLEHHAGGHHELTINGAIADPNLPDDIVDKTIHEISDEGADCVDIDYEDDSPYAEVRAAVSNLDDPSMPINTFRAWFLGMIFAILLAGVNQFFFFRYPSVTVPGLVAQLLAFPAGKLMEYTIPRSRFFNPGPFNIKEHTLITIMAGVAYQSAYATDIIAVQRVFYKQIWSFAYQILLIISTQMIGFAFAGFSRRFLVWPSAAIWPANLATTSMLNVLHQNDAAQVEEGHMSTQRFFTFATGGMFAWSFIPNYFMSCLAYFDWVTWIAPNSQKINTIFGYNQGAGLSLLTFDWGIITAIGTSPLTTPWWATANVLGGTVFFVPFLSVLLYYFTESYSFGYLPFSSSTSFDRFGKKYNVTRILNADSTFNEAAYKEYSPLYLSATFALTYGLSFAALMSAIVHVILYYRKQIWQQARSAHTDSDDVHRRLMRVYKEVPLWWYGVLFLINFALGLAAIRAWPTQLPVWAYIVSILMGAFFMLPCGIIQAITNQQIGLNVITEMVIGWANPGKPVAMMIFKTYGYISMYQALVFVADQKVAHYMKIPPRTVFWAQCSAALVGCFVQIGVQDWLFSNINGMCDRTVNPTWYCPSTQVFGTASVIYGVISPKRTFSPGAMYSPLMWFWLVGAAAPVPFYFLARRYPKSLFRYVSFPVIFSAVSLMPPYLPINFLSYCYTGFIFMYLIRRKAPGWWRRYNFVLSAAFSTGYALAIIVIFFALQYPKDGTIGESWINWRGNTIYTETLDANGIANARYQLAKGEAFGGPVGSW